MHHSSDILIIGSGLSGLLCALKLAPHYRIHLITKDQISEANTRYAQGGIAAALAEDDSIESHIQDTLNTGCGLCNRSVVEQLVGSAPRLIEELVGLGVKFNKEGDRFALGQEGGHSHRRIVYHGDTTGEEIEHSLIKRIRMGPIKIFENHTAIDLIQSKKIKPNESRQRILGAYVLNNQTGQIHTFSARYTVLATGGAGKVYLYTSNPDTATGDGLAMAHRAGCVMSNMEFVQFHPTTLYHPGSWVQINPDQQNRPTSFLISEAVRGEGARLLLPNGKVFMPQYHPQGDLAPRDTVARAVDYEMKKNGYDYLLLDISHREASFIKMRFPNIYRVCKQAGFDMSKGPLPIVPAAHYFCGGIKTDLNGRSSVDGLLAIGETAATGLHGANRLASNSLVEAAGMALFAAQYLQTNFNQFSTYQGTIPDWNPGQATDSDEVVVITQNWDEIRRLLWNYVGIVRSNKRLERAKRRILLLQEEIKEYYWNFTVTKDLLELRNIASVAEMIIDSAMLRRESRGLHYNKDFPQFATDQGHETLIFRKFL